MVYRSDRYLLYSIHFCEFMSFFFHKKTDICMIQKWLPMVTCIRCTKHSRISRANELTQGCGAGLADAKLSPFISITLFDTLKWKLKCLPNTIMTLLVSLASYILVSLHSHTSHASHIFTITTLPHYHLAWKFEKPFMISFIMLRFIQLKINELLILRALL